MDEDGGAFRDCFRTFGLWPERTGSEDGTAKAGDPGVCRTVGGKGAGARRRRSVRAGRRAGRGARQHGRGADGWGKRSMPRWSRTYRRSWRAWRSCARGCWRSSTRTPPRFLPLSRAYGMPRETDEERAARARRSWPRRSNAAAQPPLRIMEACCEAIELHRELAEKGSALALFRRGRWRDPVQRPPCRGRS